MFGKPKDYKAEQRKSREAAAPKLTKGYNHNSFPNRSERRRRAKLTGIFKYPGAWAEINARHDNVQTVVKREKLYK